MKCPKHIYLNWTWHFLFASFCNNISERLFFSGAKLNSCIKEMQEMIEKDSVQSLAAMEV